MKTILIIPTYNGGKTIGKNIEAVLSQSIQPTKIYIIDSSSQDNTIDILNKYNISYDIIDKTSFNHGKTRQEALDKNLVKDSFDIAIYLTQDIELSDKDSLKHLLSIFQDDKVACAYGRQLTKSSSSLLEKFSRQFNYPNKSIIKSKDNIKSLGLNTPFCSNSFSAYRIKDLIEIGGFTSANFGEDMLVAARFILANKKIAYVADAKCYHSHPYNIKTEYNRGKEIAIMHRANPWLLEKFGNAEKRGFELLKSVPLILKPFVLLEAMPKFLGYKLNK